MFTPPMRLATIVLAVTGLTSCGPKTWLVLRTPQGGVVGYQSGREWDEEARKANLDKAIDDEVANICPGRWHSTRDELKQEIRSAVEYVQSTSTSSSTTDYRDSTEGTISNRWGQTLSGSATTKGAATTTTTTKTQTPVVRDYVHYWRELTVVCDGRYKPETDSSSTWTTTPRVRPVEARDPPKAEPLDSNADGGRQACTDAERAEMTKAGLSQSAIERACSF